MSMMNNFNVEQLESLMDRGGSWWAFQSREGFFYLTNRHLALRIVKEEWEEDEDGWELLDLIERKYKLNEENPGEQILVLHEGVALTKPGGKIAETLDKQFSQISKKQGEITPFIYANKHFRYRWNRFSDFDLYLDDDYLRLIYDCEKETIYADGPESPAYLFGGNLVILPIKKNGSPWDKSGLNDFEKMVKEHWQLN
ncbi:hypothetical protein [Paenibacillus sp. FSL L8-0708]|uniref:hypothetical protein n=1 Tax=Paenibacillus sp. FSL L8-0708 TaxID=2975311 RepID=UPI0030F7E120